MDRSQRWQRQIAPFTDQPRGTEHVLQGTPPFFLTIGNAAEVKLVYNNKPVDLAPYTNAYGGTARLSLE